MVVFKWNERNRKMSDIANDDDVMRGQQRFVWQLYKFHLLE